MTIISKNIWLALYVLKFLQKYEIDILSEAEHQFFFSERVYWESFFLQSHGIHGIQCYIIYDDMQYMQMRDTIAGVANSKNSQGKILKVKFTNLRRQNP